MDEPTLDPFLECQMRNFEINDRPPSFRHSRAFRNFKNPPQPHMCIRDMTADGVQEVLINVMSWTRIVKPHTPNDPIPLYGGMRVLGSSSSNRSPTQVQPVNPPLLFAVMANPEVLKKASRNSVDDQDLVALVELMCEFVEAMNPGLKLLRQPVVLKDRDLSGELKNIWGAVQAKRETEREQVMPGKGTADLVVYTELGPESAVVTAARLENGTDTAGDCLVSATEEVDNVNSTANGKPPVYEVLVDQPLACNGDSQNNKEAVSDRLKGDVDEEQEHQQSDTIENVPQETEAAQEAPPKGLNAGTPPVSPVPQSGPKVAPTVSNGKVNGKAEKEVANVKEKKEKSISGFLQSGFFGKRNKDKDQSAKEKSSKPKLGSSFKSKLLMSASKEKDDKGSEANVKKILRGGGEEANTQFSEIGQSLTTAK